MKVLENPLQLYGMTLSKYMLTHVLINRIKPIIVKYWGIQHKSQNL
jgi:hypothetical protein